MAYHMLKVNTPDHDAACEECKSEFWFAALTTQFGYIYLCRGCAQWALNAREQKQGRDANGYASLLKKMFGSHKNILSHVKEMQVV